MGFIEGFATIALDEKNSEEERNLHLQIFTIIFLIKLLFIVFVAKVLWPNVMPKISSGIKPNPSVLTIFGLSIIFNLLL